MRKTRPSLPTRACRKITGRPRRARTQTAIAASSRAEGRRARPSASMRSSACFRRAGRRFAGQRGHGRIIAAVHVALVDPSRRRRHTTTAGRRARPTGAYRRSAHVSLSVRARSCAGRLPPRRALPAGEREDTRAQSALALGYAAQGARVPAERARLWRRLRGLEPGCRARAVARRCRALDMHWLQRRGRDADRLHRPPRTAAGRRGGRRARLKVYHSVDRVIVHSRRGWTSSSRSASRASGSRTSLTLSSVAAHCDEPEPPSGTTLLFFGLLRAYKGLDVLVRALALVPDARLVVAGDPLDPVEPVQQLAREIGVADRIEWRLGFLPEAEVDRADARGDAPSSCPTGVPTPRASSRPRSATAGPPSSPTSARSARPCGTSAPARSCRPATAKRSPRLHAAARRPGASRGRFEGRARAREALTWDAAAEAHERVYEAVLAAA